MPRTNFRLAVVASLALLVTVANAQDKKQKKARRGQGLRAVVSFGGNGTSLVAHPKVQADLKLSDEQKKKLTEAVKKINLARRVSGLQNLSREERRAKLRELSKSTRKKQVALAKLVKETLSTEQTARFEQIKLQTRGSRALLEKKVQEKLKVTAEQVTKMRESQKAQLTKRRELTAQLRAQEIQFRAYAQATQKIQKEGDKALLAVLTTEQQDHFKKLKGKVLDLGFRGTRIPAGGLRIQRRGGAKKAKKAVKRDDL